MTLKLSGQTFGRLTVIRQMPSEKKSTMWETLCECGTVSVKRGTFLTSGATRSCGCLQKESRASSTYKHGQNSNNKPSLTYVSWTAMVARCTNESSDKWKNYGGRGITICPSWYEFENFWKDMGDRPSKEFTLDRINVNGNYEPTNCRWATKKHQAENRRKSLSLQEYEKWLLGELEWIRSFFPHPSPYEK